MHLMRPLLGVMIGAVLAGVIGYLCAIFITVLGAWVLLGQTGYSAPAGAGTLFALMLGFALLRGILRYTEQAANHYLAFKILALIRDKVFAALRRLAPAKLETRDKGNLISVITTDIELLEVFYAHTLSPVLIALLVSLFMVGFVARFHWILALIVLAGYLVVGLGIPLGTSKKGGSKGDAFREKFGALGSTMLCSLRGLREVLQYGSGPAQLQEIQTQTQELNDTSKELKALEGWNSALTHCAILGFSLAVLLAGSRLYMLGTIGFDAVILSTVACLGSFGPVVALSSLSNNLLQTFAAGNRVLQLLDETPQIQDVQQGADPAFQGMHCENVGFGYGKAPVLENQNLHIPQEGIIGIAGKSGSGKSTLLHLLMRFWDVQAGSVKFSGIDVRGVNTRTLRKAQALVSQETHLFCDTLENNIKLAKPGASRQEVELACQKASLQDFIGSLPQGYDTQVGELGSLLSGGERQRIGLARAFLHDSPMILLDEPTSNLDSLSEGVVLQALARETAHKTVVLVSHRPSTLGIAKQIYTIQGGKCS